MTCPPHYSVNGLVILLLTWAVHRSCSSPSRLAASPPLSPAFTQFALVPEIGSAGLLVATDSALLAGYKNLASLERTTSLNMEHMQAYAMAAITKAQLQQQVRGERGGLPAAGLRNGGIHKDAADTGLIFLRRTPFPSRGSTLSTASSSQPLPPWRVSRHPCPLRAVGADPAVGVLRQPLPSLRAGSCTRS